MFLLGLLNYKQIYCSENVVTENPLISINQLKEIADSGRVTLPSYEACTDYLLQRKEGFEEYLKYNAEYQQLSKLSDRIYHEHDNSNGIIKLKPNLLFRDKLIPVYIACYIIALEAQSHNFLL